MDLRQWREKGKKVEELSALSLPSSSLTPRERFLGKAKQICRRKSKFLCSPFLLRCKGKTQKQLSSSDRERLQGVVKGGKEEVEVPRIWEYGGEQQQQHYRAVRYEDLPDG